MSEEKVRIFPLVVSMTLISAIAAGLMGWAYYVTAEPIRTAQIKKSNAALNDVLPAFDNQPSEETAVFGGVKFYIGRAGGKVSGFAGEFTTPKGYNGDVTVLAGFTPDGKITTVIVTQQSETPGLGTVVTDRRRQKTISTVLANEKESGLPPNRILDQFAGMNVAAAGAPWKVKKDGGGFDAITGATITSRAVVDAVYTVTAAFAENCDKLRDK